LSAVPIQHLKFGYCIGVMLQDLWAAVVIGLDCFIFFFKLIWFIKNH